MKFKSFNESGIRKVIRLRTIIRYYNDGGMETHCQRREGKRWKTVSMMFFGIKPSWDELHKFLYVGRGDKCREAPEPINAIIRTMQFTEHCFGIEDDRKCKRQRAEKKLPSTDT
jgi:hypothetical protein